MTRWFLIAAMLGAGCEQWKAPQRIHELESRVDELSSEVSALTGRPVAGKPKDDKEEKEGKDGKGGKAKHGKSKSDDHGKAKAAAADEDDHGKAKKSDDDDRPAKRRARKDDDDGHEATAASKPKEGDGHGESGDHEEDDAVKRLKALVAKAPTSKAGEHKAAHWGYDGKDGPSHWGELDPAWEACEKGTAQSPIDIEPKAGNASPIVFRYKPTAAAVVDNGHTLQVNLAPGSSIEIDDKVYELVQFHFHTPSEHTIAGEHYPLEVHLVHKSSGGKLAVVGVMYDAGAESRSLAAVWQKWPKKVGVEDKLKKPFDPATLLPDTRSLYRYAGSLTTPPCTEGVVWNVMRRTMTDAKSYLDAFSRHYPNNAREVQALNERKIE